jgi:Fur family ferric uptake transcriptional regulator
MVRRRMPRISLGTVYRNLEMLAESGLIRRLEGKQNRFDANTDAHYHVRCLACGRVGDVWMRSATALARRGQRVSDYEILGHRLEFLGHCPQCQQRRPQRGGRARGAGRGRRTSHDRDG